MGSVGVGSFNIIDIRKEDLNHNLVNEIQAPLNPSEDQERRFPPIWLSYGPDLKTAEETHSNDWYPTDTELRIVEQTAKSIASIISQNIQLIELGKGPRSSSVLIKTLNEAGIDCDYYVLDLSRSLLQQTFNANSPYIHEHVHFHGLFGTDDNLIRWLHSSSNMERTRVITIMGHTINYMPRERAAQFLKSFADALHPSDIVIVGIHGWNLEANHHVTYDDQKMGIQRFYRDGLKHDNKVLGNGVSIDAEGNDQNGLYQVFVSPERNIDDKSFHSKANEPITFENVVRYTSRQQAESWSDTGLALRFSYTDDDSCYNISILSPEVMHLDFQPTLYAKDPVPSIDEFQQIWKLWDLVSLKMLPTEELLSKPIYLRNCCIFYLGHIPAFLDIQITKSTSGKATEPAHFQPMFERGIDPDVDNPEKCHSHSEIPDTWPSIEEILSYQRDVRQRTISLLDGDAAKQNQTLGKALWLAYEHEAMHLETYLYMLLQSDKILPPPGAQPDFKSLASLSRANTISNSWVKLPSSRTIIGQNKESKFWTWDNEKPARTREVAAFEVRSLPITNADFVKHMLNQGLTKIPVSWIIPTKDQNEDHALLDGHTNTPFAEFIKDKAVRTVYGPIPLLFALDWPAMGSYDELSYCAKSMGGRIPTSEETKSIHATVEVVNPSDVHIGTNPEPDLFVDLTESNVGFKNFHPVPVTSGWDLAGGIARMGGAWEWTSTVLEKWEGFEAMSEYPAYTADFFDGKHNIVLGGSWATVPRIAGRRSFINWYQRNYPYAWVGARLVRDLPHIDTTGAG